MSNGDDFRNADAEAGVIEGEVLPARRGESALANPSDYLAFRTKLIEQYHRGAPSLVARLKELGKEGMEDQVVVFLNEILAETDNLLGNQLVATSNGELRDASVISFKRAEVLEKALKAVQSRQQFERDNSGVDLDSPQMVIIFRFFMSKARDTISRMGVGPEINDMFFRVFGEITNDWKKELKDAFEAARTPK